MRSVSVTSMACTPECAERRRVRLANAARSRRSSSPRSRRRRGARRTGRRSTRRCARQSRGRRRFRNANGLCRRCFAAQRTEPEASERGSARLHGCGLRWPRRRGAAGGGRLTASCARKSVQRKREALSTNAAFIRFTNNGFVDSCRASNGTEPGANPWNPGLCPLILAH